MSASPSAPEGLPPRRFEVALSYPSEQRELVERVAEELAFIVGRGGVLFDQFFQAEFARLELDAYLPELYLDASGLIVVFLCPEYVRKPWCRLEWRHIKKLATEESRRVMLLRIGSLSAEELSQLDMRQGDSAFDVDGKDPADVAELIRKRLRPPPPKAPPWTADPRRDKLRELFEKFQHELEESLANIPGKLYQLELEVARRGHADATSEPADPSLAERRLLAVFQEDDRLLVLGGPGSGKSVVLMRLAHDLDETVRQEPRPRHVPVYLSLSSWRSSDRDLSAWLGRQLNQWYSCNPKDVSRWIKSDALLPLLDGLDEIAPDDRPACIAAIDGHLKSCGGGLVVSSRRAAYEALAERLGGIQAEVMVRPLPATRIESRLAAEGRDLDALGAAVRANPELQELARSPLMLRLLTDAFRGVAASELGPILENATAGRVVEIYVERMERQGFWRYSTERTRRVLAWFARQLRARNMNRFEIEQLQPSWLPTPWRWLYAVLSRGLAGALVAAIFLVSFMSPLADYRYVPLWGLYAGVFAGALDALSLRRARPKGWRGLILLWSMVHMVALGVGTYLVFRLLWGAAAPEADLPIGFLALAFVNTLVFGLRPGDLCNDTRLFESFRWRWSWKRALWSAPGGALIGCLLWLLVRQDPVIKLAGVAFFLVIELVTCVVGFLAGAIIGGLQDLTPKIRTKPNQGLWDAVKNSFKAFACVAPFAVFAGAAFTIEFMDGWVRGAVAGVGVGLLAALGFGGIDVLQHLLLRALLNATGRFPWRWFRFLDHAVERGLLEKVDRRYRFPHGMVSDYFCSLPE